MYGAARSFLVQAAIQNSAKAALSENFFKTLCFLQQIHDNMYNWDRGFQPREDSLFTLKRISALCDYDLKGKVDIPVGA